MTIKMKKSELPADFDRLLENYRLAMEAHQVTVGKPAPVAALAIEQCVRRVQSPGSPDAFVADYVVIDDTPPPPTLAEKKQQLVHQLHEAEASARSALSPFTPGKERLEHMMLQAVSLKDERNRTTDEHALVNRVAETSSAIGKVDLLAAQVEADIADLTDQNVDSFVIPPLR